MIKMCAQVMANLYGKDLIAFGTGTIGRRMIPYLAQNPDLKLCGVTNSRIADDDGGTYLDTGLPLRSIYAWADRLPNATIFITAFTAIDEIITVCREAGFQNFEFITWEMMNAFIKMENQIAESHLSEHFAHLCLANELHDAHKAAFSEFRSCNRGKTVAVVGTGPTLCHYKQVPGIPHIGVNTSILKDDIQLDYYFLSDYVPDLCEKLKNYSCIKFFGTNRNSNSTDQLPEYIVEENGGRRFFSTLTVPGTEVHTNIECYPLMGYNSIIFPAIHFALYTHPEKLLLIGCDCSSSGHFDDGVFYEDCVTKIQIPQWIDGYQKVRKFAAIHYPDTEIISVNPVGLKGIFQDMYTESYLNTHPEIDRSKCGILNCGKVQEV